MSDGERVIIPRPYRRTPVAERFWSKVNKDGPVVGPGLGPCWTWTGSINSDGYGRFRVRGEEIVAASRVSWWLTVGDPGSLFVCHHCDNRLCVNPAHLFVGTNADNQADMVAKGRSRRGELSPKAKLTNHAVMTVAALAQEGHSPAALAARFGVRPDYIKRIITGQSWSFITGIRRATAAQKEAV